MKKAVFTFHEALNDFLPPVKRGRPVESIFQGDQSVKHLIESLHIPHPEVGEIYLNGASVDLGYIVQDGDQIEVFPFIANESICASDIRFLLDNHLGKLAAFLRILGFDALYQNRYQDEELALISSQDGRILLTRDRGLLMRKIIIQGYCLRSLDPVEQLDEVVSRYHLAPMISPFQRCVHCNHLLQPVEKEAVIERLEPLTRLYFDEFHICPACQQIYWKGSHYDHLVRFIMNRYH
jgi:hypothetical protein